MNSHDENTKATKDLLIEKEKEFLEAYKSKNEEKFKKNAAADYVGIANDGSGKTIEDEIEKMRGFDLDELHLTDEKLFFPAENVAVLTYTMVSAGKFKGQSISASIYTSTVYVKRLNEWAAVLHTESMAS